MRSGTRMWLGAALVVLNLVALAACGGGGGASVPEVVSGVAATGAPFHGTIYLKDSSITPIELSTTTAADGSFSFNVSALKAPFLLKTSTGVSRNSGAGPDYSLASGPGTANINPLSTLAVCAANGSNDLATLYAAPDPAKMQAVAAQLPDSVAKVQAALHDVLSQFGAASVNFITDTYTANHQGVDLMLDLISVATSNGTVYLTDRTTNQTMQAPLYGFLTGSAPMAFTLPVTGSGNVCVFPAAPSIYPASTIQLSAVVIGMQNQQVTWSVTTPNGGSISGGGLYTAPTTPGTYYVSATSTSSGAATTIPITVTTSASGSRNAGGSYYPQGTEGQSP